jgi:8-oxo-dGTP diphosphatase
LRIFGTKVDGQIYHARKAVYAVIPDNVGRVAAIIADNGKLWLPGGGIETGETPEQALVREVEEECAQRLHIVGNIGEALQYFYARSDDTYFAMHAVFYEGVFLGQTTGRAEHPLIWIFPDDRAYFFHACHAWAAQRLRQARIQL